MKRTTKLPVVKSPDRLFFRYLYHVFAPMVIQKGKGIIWDDPYCGTLYWNLEKGWSVSVCPVWEDEIDTMTVELDKDGSGNPKIIGKIAFPINDWTMVVEEDSTRYINVVKKFLKKKGLVPTKIS